MMTRKHWSAVEISAYLDDVLDHETRTSFETTLKHDKALREKVDAVRETIHFVKSAPMRVPPRNYLLTPGMVKESQRQSIQPRRASLRWMRLATSLTAVAFMITFGLNLLNVTPKMTANLIDGPDEQQLSIAQEDEFAWADDNAETENHTVPAPQRESEPQMLQVEENAQVAPTVAPTVAATVAPTVAPAVAPTVAATPRADQVGESMEAAPATSVEGNIQETEQTSETEEDIGYTEKAAPPSDTASGATTAITPTQVPRTMMDAPPPAPDPLEPSIPASFPLRWIVAFLGLLTMVFAFVTFKMSRRS